MKRVWWNCCFEMDAAAKQFVAEHSRPPHRRGLRYSEADCKTAGKAGDSAGQSCAGTRISRQEKIKTIQSKRVPISEDPLRLNPGSAGFLANLLRDTERKRGDAIMRDCPVYVYCTKSSVSFCSFCG
jgi:hypothetical protein